MGLVSLLNRPSGRSSSLSAAILARSFTRQGLVGSEYSDTNPSSFVNLHPTILCVTGTMDVLTRLSPFVAAMIQYLSISHSFL